MVTGVLDHLTNVSKENLRTNYRSNITPTQRKTQRRQRNDMFQNENCIENGNSNSHSRVQ